MTNRHFLNSPLTEIRKEIEYYERIFDEECVELTELQENFIGGKVEALKWVLKDSEDLK